MGCPSAIAAVAHRSSSVALPVALEVDDDLPDVSPAVEEATFWIVTEALHNVVRHAQADNCRVSIAGDQTRLRIVVDDDGIGLPERSSDGVGLDSIRLRAEEVGGYAVIESGGLGGTRVVAELPLTALQDRHLQ